MFKNNDGSTGYSASDLIHFSECRHHTVLDLTVLAGGTPAAGTDDPHAELLARKGDEHEKAYLARLYKEGRRVVEIDKSSHDVALRQTGAAMKSGADVIFQAALKQGSFFGYADFLERVPGDGAGHGYEVVDTKLARSPKGKFLVQLGHYSDMLADTICPPQKMSLVFGNGDKKDFRVANYRYYVRGLRDDFLAFVKAPKATYPLPVGYCGLCKWRLTCEEKRERDDHLSGIASIRGSQIDKLEDADIRTMTALAAAPASLQIPRLAPETLVKLRRQVRLQVQGRTENRLVYELIQDTPPDRGLGRLPPANAGDVFFDFEGDPLIDGGLEYLFGIGYFENGKWAFKPIWAHSHEAERNATHEFVDWIMARIRQHPGLHVYHYGSYEKTALQRLRKHGRDAELDALLRGTRFVDLLNVVRESVVTSEPGYSLKNIEKFFRPERVGGVTDAGSSIVKYELWRETQDPAILKEIVEYNEFDVESTAALTKWLRGLVPAGQKALARHVDALPLPSKRVQAHEAALERLKEKVVGSLPARASKQQRAFRELVFDLLDFHRRTEKPAWWAMFARCDASFEDLLDDLEAIAGCRRLDQGDPERKGILADVVYRYPEQDFKLRLGSDVMDASTSEKLGSIVFMDEGKRLVGLNLTKKARANVPDEVHLGAGGPLDTTPLRVAMQRYGTAIAANGDKAYPAVHDLLTRHAPRIKGRNVGEPVVAPGQPVLTAALEALLKLQDSSLFIQGPPGCGKTYSASWLIVELMRKGKRIGISSNSHKAIHNLLEAVEDRAKAAGFRFNGIKKSSANDPDTAFLGENIRSTDGKAFLEDRGVQLAAGTAWLFADERAEQEFDYLFIDEAGQVSLANVVAMGMAARNIVLVGDQMQLGQPIQGVHRGDSGLSSLEYLLRGRATVPPDEGILLETTWRMHPDVCSFISNAVYDGRLLPHPSTARQRLVLGDDADPRLKATGLAFVPVQHDNCRQRSDQEAAELNNLYRNLLKQGFVDQQGKEHAIAKESILVVAPYNLQVDRLKQVLPEGARVGTVDKFQGQEAEVVLVSMTTSNGDCLPRTLDFLFSRNRLNVAISRARSLSVVLACPDLLHISCSTPEQMELVNVLAWFAAQAGAK